MARWPTTTTTTITTYRLYKANLPTWRKGTLWRSYFYLLLFFMSCRLNYAHCNPHKRSKTRFSEEKPSFSSSSKKFRSTSNQHNLTAWAHLYSCESHHSDCKWPIQVRSTLYKCLKKLLKSLHSSSSPPSLWGCTCRLLRVEIHYRYLWLLQLLQYRHSTSPLAWQR